jgi:hypothetical protein
MMSNPRFILREKLKEVRYSIAEEEARAKVGLCNDPKAALAWTHVKAFVRLLIKVERSPLCNTWERASRMLVSIDPATKCLHIQGFQGYARSRHDPQAMVIPLPRGVTKRWLMPEAPDRLFFR